MTTKRSALSLNQWSWCRNGGSLTSETHGNTFPHIDLSPQQILYRDLKRRQSWKKGRRTSLRSDSCSCVMLVSVIVCRDSQHAMQFCSIVTSGQVAHRQMPLLYNRWHANYLPCYYCMYKSHFFRQILQFVLHDKSTVVQYSSSVVNLIYTRLKNLKLLNYDIGPEEDFLKQYNTHCQHR